MAQNEAVFAIRITDNGTLQIVQKEAKKAAAGLNDLGAATDRAGEGQDRFNRGQKGVIGAAANGTKSFSKMRDAIGGSSGLVGAYATLAANVFALSAAFNALGRAAKLEQLRATLETIGTSSGQNLIKLSESLRTVTGNAISMGDAMKAASLGTSAGFNPEQLQTLAKVAKGASAALGRDLGESYDRLIRGAAKLEPEILDELGIIVRIRDATEAYARTVGKTANELTTFERQQAFVNAINEQGIAKFGAVAATIEATPYEKLAAAVDNLSKALINFTNDSGITTFINYLSESTTALAGVFIAFAGTISKQMLPAVYAIPNALAAIASPKAEASLNNLGQTIDASAAGFDKFGKGAKKALLQVSTELKSGTVSTASFDAAQVSLSTHTRNYSNQITGLNNKLAIHTKELRDGSITAQEFAIKEAEINRQLAIQQQRLSQAAAATQVLSTARNQSNAALAAQNLSTAISQIGSGAFFSTGEGSMIEGFKLLGTTIGSVWTTAARGPTVLGVLGAAFRTLGAVIGTVVSIGLRFLGWIGLIIALAPGLIDWVKNKFFPETEMEKKQKILDKMRDSVEGFFKDLQKTKISYFIDFQADGLEGVIASLEIFTNTLDGLINALVESKNTAIEAFREMANEDYGVAYKQTAYTEASYASVRATEAARKQFDYINSRPMEGLEVPLNFAIDPNDIQSTVEKVNREISIREGRDAYILAQEVLPMLMEALTAQKAMNSALKEYEDTQKKAATFAERLAEPELINQARDAVIRYKAELKSLFDRATEKTGTDFTAQYENVAQQLDKISQKTSSTEIYSGLQTLRTEYKNFVVTLRQAGEQANAVGDSLDKLTKKSDTPYTEALKNVNELLKQRETLENQIRNAGTKERRQALEDQLKIVDATLQNVAAARGLKGSYADLKNVLGTLDSLYREQETARNEFQQFKDVILQAAKIAPELSNVLLEKEQDYINQQIALIEEKKKIPGTSPEVIKALDNEIAVLNNSVDIQKRKLEIAQEITNAYYETAKQQQQINNLMLDNEKIQAQLQNYAKTGKTEFTLSQQLDFIKKERDSKIAVLRVETAIGITKLGFERLTFDLTIMRLRAEAAGDSEKLAALDKIQGEYNNLFERRLQQEAQVASEREKNINNSSALEIAKLAESNKLSAGTTVGIIPQGGEAFDVKGYVNNINTAKENVVTAATADIEAKMAVPGTSAAELQALEERLARIKEGGDPLVNLRAGLAQAQATMSPFIASMKELGPEGALIASVAEGGLAIANSWSQAAETIKGSGSAMEKGAAIAQAAGATLGAINQMLQANSTARISAIDSEIAAEQKRDGKSKESLARIAALEKKKEAEKKKAFEMNKKMQMAQTVINTAAAVMEAAPNIPLMVLMGVMGAAQLALIASQSYQGGGASTSAGAPSSIAVGQRTSSIDLAKSKSASGELSYLQGAQGMGGPEAFTPAFTGMKYRASGGATTGFMVGEQGPELFIPDRPGTIVPADQTANMGGVTNVNFSISAIDTQGVEDMLENQKGAIINMIRSAANSYGQPFIEQVDTSVYRPAPKSRTYRR